VTARPALDGAASASAVDKQDRLPSCIQSLPRPECQRTAEDAAVSGEEFFSKVHHVDVREGSTVSTG
jgi:hypothetical protein